VSLCFWFTGCSVSIVPRLGDWQELPEDGTYEGTFSGVVYIGFGDDCIDPVLRGLQKLQTRSQRAVITQDFDLVIKPTVEQEECTVFFLVCWIQFFLKSLLAFIGF